ncbi:MAG: TetR/AcrR family transcriptional regulator [Henriciella sp.]|nr:TetR/AcrR family transcriptional regulator [Henriciella sp.]
MLRARTVSDKDSRRQELLDAALDEFFERGFSAARMEDIAKRAGLSKGTLYLYFDSKDALFKAIIDALATPNLEVISAIATSAPSFSEALDRVAVFAPTVIRTSKLPRLMKVIVGDSHTFPEILIEYRQNILDRILGLFGELLSQAKAAGEIEVEDPYLAARIVMGPMLLSGLWHALFSDTPGGEVDLEKLFRMHASAMKKAFAPVENSQ